MCEYFQNRTSCPSSDHERYRKRCRPTAIGRPARNIAEWKQGFHLALLSKPHLTATETVLKTVGYYIRHIRPKSVRNTLPAVSLQACHFYAVLPLTRTRQARRMPWLAAHASRRFHMRQWRLIFQVYSFFVRSVDVVCTDVVQNSSLTLSLSTGIGLGWLGYGLGSGM